MSDSTMPLATPDTSAGAGSALDLTPDDIKLIDSCLAHCQSNLEAAGNGYTCLFKMACVYTRDRVAEVRMKLTPNTVVRGGPERAVPLHQIVGGES